MPSVLAATPTGASRIGVVVRDRSVVASVATSSPEAERHAWSGHDAVHSAPSATTNGADAPGTRAWATGWRAAATSGKGAVVAGTRVGGAFGPDGATVRGRLDCVVLSSTRPHAKVPTTTTSTDAARRRAVTSGSDRPRERITSFQHRVRTRAKRSAPHG